MFWPELSLTQIIQNRGKSEKDSCLPYFLLSLCRYYFMLKRSTNCKEIKANKGLTRDIEEGISQVGHHYDFLWILV